MSEDLLESKLPDDLLDLFFADIGEVPLLEPEEEPLLAQRIQAGREAQDRLATEPDLDEAARADLTARAQQGRQAFDQFVTANLRLVVAEASKFARRSQLSLDELIQEGSLGLIRAVEKFDWNRGLKFSTYAIWWIRQALQRGAADKERIIRLPTAVHGNLVKVRAAQSRLQSQWGRLATLEELAEATNLTEDQIRHVLAADYAVMSLDKPVTSEDDAAEFGALLARAVDAPDEEVVERLFVEEIMAIAQRELPERSWYVLCRRYGLQGEEPATLQDLGEELGLSRETVRLMQHQSLEVLKRAIRRLQVTGGRFPG